MKAGPEVFFVKLKASLEMKNRLFVILLLLTDDSKVEVGIHHRAVWTINSALEQSPSFIHVTFLLANTAKPDQSLRNLTINLD